MSYVHYEISKMYVAKLSEITNSPYVIFNIFRFMYSNTKTKATPNLSVGWV